VEATHNCEPLWESNVKYDSLRLSVTFLIALALKTNQEMP